MLRYAVLKFCALLSAMLAVGLPALLGYLGVSGLALAVAALGGVAWVCVGMLLLRDAELLKTIDTAAGFPAWPLETWWIKDPAKR